jgi:hypothetical protein
VNDRAVTSEIDFDETFAGWSRALLRGYPDD